MVWAVTFCFLSKNWLKPPDCLQWCNWILTIVEHWSWHLNLHPWSHHSGFWKKLSNVRCLRASCSVKEDVGVEQVKSNEVHKDAKPDFQPETWNPSSGGAESTRYISLQPWLFFSVSFCNTARKVWLLSGAKDKNPTICMQDQEDLLFSCKVLD